MKLSEFVAESLKEIIIGVKIANRDVGELSGIAPGTKDGEPLEIVEDIAFEIAVTVKENKTGKKSGGGSAEAEINVVGIKASFGGKGDIEKQSTTENENVSKISFKVPVNLNAGIVLNDGFKRDNEKLERVLKRLGKD